MDLVARRRRFLFDYPLHVLFAYLCRMKSVVHLFMGVYLLLLSVLPCADACQLLRPLNTTTQISADSHAHHSDRADGDLCSPFCSCACCGTLMHQPPQFTFSFTPPQAVAQTWLSLETPALPTAPRSTWQPPQLD